MSAANAEHQIVALDRSARHRASEDVVFEVIYLDEPDAAAEGLLAVLGLATPRPAPSTRCRPQPPVPAMIDPTD